MKVSYVEFGDDFVAGFEHRHESERFLLLRRRSQGNHLQRRRLQCFVARWLPPARICHPYPLVRYPLGRFGVLTQGGSRMR